MQKVMIIRSECDSDIRKLQDYLDEPPVEFHRWKIVSATAFAQRSNCYDQKMLVVLERL